MNIKHDFTEMVGNTPLIKLQRASEETGCTILGKAEFLNPGQSIKDRAALSIIQNARASGRLRPGGIIVEGTAGNTGIGLTLIGNKLRHPSIIIIPETQSQEKKDMLRLFGAKVIEIPAVPYSNPNNYIHLSGRLAKELDKNEPNGAIWANQFDNTANRDAHLHGTGPEIWSQTEQKVDGFVCAAGTGGTIAGVSMALKQRNADIVTALADPDGSGLYSFFKTGVFDPAGSSITEGIGNNRETANLAGAPIDDAFKISDAEALPHLFNLLIEEGLCLGGSSAINIAGAICLARQLGSGHIIVTVLCDHGSRYQSKLFNPAFLRSKNLTPPQWIEEHGPEIEKSKAEIEKYGSSDIDISSLMQ